MVSSFSTTDSRGMPLKRGYNDVAMQLALIYVSLVTAKK